MMINCIRCDEKYHISWAREWCLDSHGYVAIPTEEFVCLTCKIRIKN